MHLASLAQMIESGFDERALLGTGDRHVTGAQFATTVGAAASTLDGRPALVYAGENHPLLPVALFAAAWSGIPFVPLNYRLEDHRLNGLVERHPGALVLADPATALRISAPASVVVLDEWLDTLPAAAPEVVPSLDDEQTAVVLYTSGTTAEPKAVLLRHRHLMAYLLGSVEFASATEDEAVLIAVPPYHVAGVANMLSSLFAGRRLVYLRSFDARQWLRTVRDERITHAMVVPTMLARIVDAMERDAMEGDVDVGSLRTLSYGGARVSHRVLLQALEHFPSTGFVNAYGLTETASTIAVLGPEDHRAAVESDDPVVRRRLTSAGRVIPTVDVEIRDERDEPLPAGASGIVHVRGEQIAGEYATGSVLGRDGWFCTKDRGFVDDDGYLFIEGRADDTIIRGGENIAPAEIEEVLLTHAAVADACVIGVPDEEWGQRIAAVVVLRRGALVDGDELRELVRAQLRGSKTPDAIVFREALPHTDTGKVLRRAVLDDVLASG